MPHPHGSGDSNPGEYDLNSIAVIGLSCRFPGDASNANKFWDLLCEGKCAFAFFFFFFMVLDIVEEV
jgi:hypothetical protein